VAACPKYARELILLSSWLAGVVRQGFLDSPQRFVFSLIEAVGVDA
jgi:hypothetical protein